MASKNIAGLEKVARIASGVIFVAAGTFKLLHVPLFRGALASLGVPLPVIGAVLVPLLEVGGGFGLLFNFRPRVWAALLAIDMLGAIALVGLPGRFGRAIVAANVRFGDESWRLPLEIALLGAMIFLTFRRSKTC